MKVVLITQCVVAGEVRPPRSLVELPDDQAALLIAAGSAISAEPEAPPPAAEPQE